MYFLIYNDAINQYCKACKGYLCTEMFISEKYFSNLIMFSDQIVKTSIREACQKQFMNRCRLCCMLF